MKSTRMTRRTMGTILMFTAVLTLGACGDSSTPAPPAPPAPADTTDVEDTTGPAVDSVLCRPCLEDSQCAGEADQSDKTCVDFGDAGRYCLPACTDDAECEEGYSCTDTGDDGSNKRCWPVSGECACSDKAILDAASTICFTKNAIGTCIGNRECGPDGLTACSSDEAAVEVCDGVDNNCDGETDEGTDSLPCGQGDPAYPCGGQTKCIAGTKTCEPFPPTAEICDLLDNDCDGETDEDFPGVGEACDGPDDDLCADGILACSGDNLSTICTKEGSGPGAEEICDGKDNDCDGNIDEDFPTLGQACDGDDDDLCENGVITCAADGTAACDEASSSETLEVCDGQDNDCDGGTDEGLLNACGGCGEVPAEICDGKDNDCDGNIDEGFVGNDCGTTNQYGTCTGTTICFGTNGMTCNAPQPMAEVCDGQDNDCDGSIDEGSVCASPEEAILVLDGLSGEVRRTFDQGQTWDTVGTVPFKKLSMVPSITRIEQQTLFAAAYQQVKDSLGNYIYDGPHVMRSDDGGANWYDIGAWGQNVDPKASPVALCGHPSSGLPIYGTDRLGDLYRSLDGLTFQKTTTWETTNARVACAIGYDGAVFTQHAGFCALNSGACKDFWISTDVGGSLVQWSSPTQPGSYPKAVLATSKKHIGHVYASTGEHTISRTQDSGGTWLQLVADVPAGPKPVSGIILDANDTIYVATVTSASGSKPCDPSSSATGCTYYGGQFYFSTNQGQTWNTGADWIDGGNGGGWLSMTTAFYPGN